MTRIKSLLPPKATSQASTTHITLNIHIVHVLIEHRTACWLWVLNAFSGPAFPQSSGNHGHECQSNNPLSGTTPVLISFLLLWKQTKPNQGTLTQINLEREVLIWHKCPNVNSSLREISSNLHPRTEAQPPKGTAYLLAQHLFYIMQDHLPRGVTTHSRQDPLTLIKTCLQASDGSI